VIVSTSTGAAEPRLLAACGVNVDLDIVNGDTNKKVSLGKSIPERTNAPDGLPPLFLPFVIVDEACQSVEPATLIPLTASNSCRSLVLLGDPCQLPATVKSDPDSILSISLMERLAATLPQPSINMGNDDSAMDTTYLASLPTKQAQSLLRSMQRRESTQVGYKKRFAGSLLLSIQYRMHPSIAAFPSAVFYEGLLSTPDLLGSHRPFPRVLSELMPNKDRSLAVRMIHVGGRCNERRGEGNKFTNTVYIANADTQAQESTSYRNEAEAVRVVDLIKDIIRKNYQDDPFSPKSIGVVTPYTGQVQLIKSMIANDAEMNSLAREGSASIEVKSVDGYQGRERDVIIFSAVRSNRNGNLGFLTDWRRLNVALTRARTALLVVGDVDTLKEGDKHWAAFAKWCQGAGCIVEDTADSD
jgi:superfamily I DNA and/or RNA helicase